MNTRPFLHELTSATDSWSVLPQYFGWFGNTLLGRHLPVDHHCSWWSTNTGQGHDVQAEQSLWGSDGSPENRFSKIAKTAGLHTLPLPTTSWWYVQYIYAQTVNLLFHGHICPPLSWPFLCLASCFLNAAGHSTILQRIKSGWDKGSVKTRLILPFNSWLFYIAFHNGSFSPCFSLLHKTEGTFVWKVHLKP